MYSFETCATRKFISWTVITMVLFFMGVGSAFSSDSVRVQAKHSEAQAKSIYEIFFSISREIPVKAEIVVTFPVDFDLSGILVVGSTTINGGFEFSIDGSKLVIKRSGLGKTIAPNEKVDVKFANVKNPAAPADNYTIKVELKNDRNEALLEKEDVIKINPQAK